MSDRTSEGIFGELLLGVLPQLSGTPGGRILAEWIVKQSPNYDFCFHADDVDPLAEYDLVRLKYVEQYDDYTYALPHDEAFADAAPWPGYEQYLKLVEGE